MAEQHEPRFNTRGATGNKISIKFITEEMHKFQTQDPFSYWADMAANIKAIKESRVEVGKSKWILRMRLV